MAGYTNVRGEVCTFSATAITESLDVNLSRDEHTPSMEMQSGPIHSSRSIFDVFQQSLDGPLLSHHRHQIYLVARG